MNIFSLNVVDIKWCKYKQCWKSRSWWSCRSTGRTSQNKHDNTWYTTGTGEIFWIMILLVAKSNTLINYACSVFVIDHVAFFSGWPAGEKQGTDRTRAQKSTSVIVKNKTLAEKTAQKSRWRPLVSTYLGCTY